MVVLCRVPRDTNAAPDAAGVVVVIVTRTFTAATGSAERLVLGSFRKCHFSILIGIVHLSSERQLV